MTGFQEVDVGIGRIRTRMKAQTRRMGTTMVKEMRMRKTAARVTRTTMRTRTRTRTTRIAARRRRPGTWR